MGKYYYELTPKRKRCKTKCKYQHRFVGSVDCRGNCKSFNGYGYIDEKVKRRYVNCAKIL